MRRYCDMVLPIAAAVEQSPTASNTAATQQQQASSPCISIVQVAVGHSEDLGELGVVCGHHLRLGGLFALCEQALNVFHTSEGLLPQLQVAGHLQLLEASLQVQVHGLWVAKVWPVTLVSVPASMQHVSWLYAVRELAVCSM